MPQYPDNWNEIALSIKEQVQWRCQNCQHPHDSEKGYTLTVHHIDSDTSNNEPWNLVALCQRCHLHHQHRQPVRQLSFFNRPPWIIRYLDAVQSKSSGLTPILDSKLPG